MADYPTGTPDRTDKSVANKRASADPVTRAEMGEDISPVKLWLEEIQAGKDANEDYWKLCDKIIEKYKDAENSGSDSSSPSGRRGNRSRKFNVLWSMVQTMQPLVYNKPPKPYVSRRYNDKDPVGRDAALMLQRSLSFGLEDEVLHDALLDARDDFILASRGAVWAKYSPYMAMRDGEREVLYEEGSTEIPEGVELQTGPDGTQYYVEQYQYEEKVYEEVDWEHVHYRDFLHGPAAKWRHVPWVARRVPMTRKQLIKRFGDEMGKKPPLTINNRRRNGNKMTLNGSTISDEDTGLFGKAEVWEIWCKETRSVKWVCPDYPDAFLDEQDDFLDLDGFFPCPRPAYGTKTSESLMPTPDYKLWQDIAIELDDVTHRIKLLTEALRVVGVYDKSMGDALKRITTQTEDNELIPVDSWSMFSEKGGLRGAIEFLPVEQVAGVLDKLYMSRTRLVQELYEITGISDIVRGASDPRETAKAQQIKGNYAGKRIGVRTDEMTRMAREAMEIQAEIICKHYSAETISMISSADQILTHPLTGQADPGRFMRALQLLKRNTLRQYRIKVDEQSLAASDIDMERNEKIQFMSGFAQLLTGVMPIVETMPDAKPLMGELILYATRAFPMARSVEANIEQAVQAFIQAPAPQKQEEQAAQGKSPAEIQIEQAKLQIEQQRVELDRMRLELDKQKAMAEAQIKAFETQMQTQNRMLEAELRAKKQSDDTQLRAAQIAQQAESTENAQILDFQKWAGDKEEGQARLILDATKAEAEDARKREEAQAKRRAEYQKAFAGGSEA